MSLSSDHPEKRPSLESVLKLELTSRGYVEVDPIVAAGGMWTHPDWETAADVETAIRDCLDRESGSGRDQ